MVKKRFDGWLIVSVVLLLLFIAVLIYPMFGVIKQAVIMPDGSFSWEQFHKFFSNSYYVDTIYNSFKITIFVTVLTLVIGIPFAYFYAFYRAVIAHAGEYVLLAVGSEEVDLISVYFQLYLAPRFDNTVDGGLLNYLDLLAGGEMHEVVRI